MASYRPHDRFEHYLLLICVCIKTLGFRERALIYVYVVVQKLRHYLVRYNKHLNLKSSSHSLPLYLQSGEAETHFH